MSYQTGTAQDIAKKFAKLVSDYCAFLEDHCAYSAKQFTAQNRVYLTAIDRTLPNLPQTDSINIAKVDLGPTNWITRNITEKLGEQDSYGTEAESSTYSGDLTKIYTYLKQGVLIYNTDPASAVAHWKSRFADYRPDLQRLQSG